MRSSLVLAGLTTILALAYLWGVQDIPHVLIGDPLGPRAFPIMIGVCLLIVAGLLFMEGIKAKSPVEDPSEEKTSENAALMTLIKDRNVLITLGTMLVFAVAFESLGYLISISLLMLVLTNTIHRGHYVMNTVFSIGFTIVTYLVFDTLLGADLPSGILGS